MEKKIKSRITAVCFLVLACSAFIFIQRTIPVSFFIKAGDKMCDSPDILVVLGGGIKAGGVLGISTHERTDHMLNLARKYSKADILVSEYPAGRHIMENYLIENGIDNNRFVFSEFTFDEDTGGSVNNVYDILCYLSEQNEFKKVVIVTSPYHERRVMLILKALSESIFDKTEASFCFSHPENGDIFNSTFRRYAGLLLHEVAGIIYFKWNKEDIIRNLKQKHIEFQRNKD